MIVIVGSLAWRASPPAAPAGRACGIALGAVARGARVELVGRAGEDPAGEALLLALARAGVGHAAVLRDATRPTPVARRDVGGAELDDAWPLAEPSASGASAAPADAGLDGADVDLAIKYLGPSGVLVVADDVGTEALAAAVEAGRYAGTRLVVLLGADAEAARRLPVDLPEDATVLSVPGDGAEGAFERLVGDYAAALDAGAAPAEAFAAAQGATGWEAAGAD